MNYKICLLSAAILAACNPSEKTIDNSAPTPLTIELPTDTVLHESKTYSFSLANADQFASINWTQTSGPDYGWSQDDQGLVSITLPELPIGTEQSLTFKVAVTSADGRSAESLHSVTVKSNDHLLYISENQSTGAERLYVLNAETGVSTALTLIGTDKTRIYSFIASPNGDQVALRANLDDDDIAELYLVSLDGGDLVKLNTPIVAEGGSVVNYEWTADGHSIVYKVDNQLDNQYQLYRVRLSDLSQQKLSGNLVENGNTGTYAIAPTDDAILFTADAELDGMTELYLTDFATGTRTKLNQTMTAEGDVYSPTWSPNGQHIAFRADATTDSEINLYIVSREGGEVSKLNGPLVENGDVSTGFQWLPDSSGLVFKADDEVDGQYNLYQRQIDGSALVRINEDLVADGDVYTWKLNDTGTHVAFSGDILQDGVIEMFVAQIDGGNRTRLNNAFVPGGNVHGFDWASSAGPIVFMADGDVDSRLELYAANINGTNRRKISDPIGEFENEDMDVQGYIIAPDGSFLVYLADQYIDERDTLFKVDLSNDHIDNTLVGISAQAQVVNYDVRPDGEQVFALTTMVDTTTNLVLASPEGGDAATINETTKDVGVVTVSNAIWSPDQSGLAYIANETDDYNGLYYVDIATQTATRMDTVDTTKIGISYMRWVE